jgi:hypothetical protein
VNRLTAPLVVLSLLASAGCDPPDLSGTYVGQSSTGSCRLPDGREVTLPGAGDLLTIKSLGHEYDHTLYDVTVRGCTVSGYAKGGGTITLGSLGYGSQPCTFDVPSVGPAAVEVMGGITGDRGGVHLSMGITGKDGKVRNCAYPLDTRSR